MGRRTNWQWLWDYLFSDFVQGFKEGFEEARRKVRERDEVARARMHFADQQERIIRKTTSELMEAEKKLEETLKKYGLTDQRRKH